MCAVYLGSRLLYPDRAMLNAFGAAALGLFIYDPQQLCSPSFQMTFLCVLIVGGVGIPFWNVLRSSTNWLWPIGIRQISLCPYHRRSPSSAWTCS